MRAMLPTLVLASLSLPATAQQTVLYTLQGDSPGDELGSSAVAVGDLDGDGVNELAVGSPGDSIRHVRIFSGQSGTFLFSLSGQAPGDGYGSSVAAVGDVDGDGLTELAVAAPAGGYVELVSLPTQARLWTSNIPVTQVARGGDIDADGTLDVLALRSGGGSSELRVLSGATGTAGLTLNFPTEEWRFLDGGGDADGDGHADILLGNPFWPTGNWTGTSLYPGRLRVYSGASGAVLHDKAGSLFEDHAGWGVSWMDDLDGDGSPEFAAGMPADIFFADPGRVRIWSGSTGAFHGDMYAGTFADGFGTGIADAGDLDGDGVGDLLIARGPYGHFLYAYSGATLQQIFVQVVSGDALDFPAPVIGALDDLDGDGTVEVFTAKSTGTPEGHLLVYGACPTPTSFCVAAPNSAFPNGAKQGWAGSTSVSTNNFWLQAYFLPPNMPGLFLYSAGQQQVPFGNGSLCVGGGGSGVFRILPLMQNPQQAGIGLKLDFTQPPFNAGPGAITPGSTWHFQYWYRDIVAPPAFFNLSDGLRVTFCP